MIIEIVKCHAELLNQLNRLLADVPDECLAEQPSGMVNHPAWTIGHLIGANQLMMTFTGTEPWLELDWNSRYGRGSTPAPDRSVYPPHEKLMEMLADSQTRVEARLKEVGETAMTQPVALEQLRERFPSLGYASMYLLAAHAAIHVGQVGAWRRTMDFATLA